MNQAMMLPFFFLQGRFEQRSNIVLIVLDGDSKPFDKEKTPILEMIAKEQEKLVSIYSIS